MDIEKSKLLFLLLSLLLFDCWCDLRYFEYCCMICCKNMLKKQWMMR